jgi:hypothetical protein
MLDPHGESLTAHQHPPAEPNCGYRRAVANAARDDIADMSLRAMEELRDFLDRQEVKTIEWHKFKELFLTALGCLHCGQLRFQSGTFQK